MSIVTADRARSSIYEVCNFSHILANKATVGLAVEDQFSDQNFVAKPTHLILKMKLL